MNDIVPEILENLLNAFDRKMQSDPEIRRIRKAVSEKTAQSVDSERFSVRAGEILSEAFSECVDAQELPNGKMYYNIASRLIDPSAKSLHGYVSKTAADIIGIQNTQAGPELARVIPATADINQDRIDGLIEYACNADQYADIEKQFLEKLVNYSQSIHADTVQKNADINSKMGFKPKIHRKTSGKCCDWCTELAGDYDYRSDMDRDVFRRHANCRCQVLYDPDGSGKMQDAHTKQKGTEKELHEKHRKRIEQQQKEREEKEMRRRIKAAEVAARTDDPAFAEYVLKNPKCLEINEEKQNRHRPGTKEYSSEKSILNLTTEEAQELVYRLAGTGDSHFRPNNEKETVTADRVIGTVVWKDEDGSIVNLGETKRFTIHFSKTGCHIVPTSE